MDSKTLRETKIKPKLVENFGKVLATSILIAGNAAGMKAATDDEKKIAIIESICNNDKVVAMWGSKISRFKYEWLRA